MLNWWCIIFYDSSWWSMVFNNAVYWWFIMIIDGKQFVRMVVTANSHCGPWYQPDINGTVGTGIIVIMIDMTVPLIHQWLSTNKLIMDSVLLTNSKGGTWSAKIFTISCVRIDIYSKGMYSIRAWIACVIIDGYWNIYLLSGWWVYDG